MGDMHTRRRSSRPVEVKLDSGSERESGANERERLEMEHTYTY